MEVEMNLKAEIPDIKTDKKIHKETRQTRKYIDHDKDRHKDRRTKKANRMSYQTDSINLNTIDQP